VQTASLNLLIDGTYDVFFIRLGTRDDKLDFFFPVDKGTDSRNTHNGDQNSKALNPCYNKLLVILFANKRALVSLGINYLP